MPDKYNFYKNSVHKSIGMDSTSVLKKSRSRILSPSEANLLDLKNETIAMDEREHPRNSTIALPEVKSQRSRDNSRDRSL